MKGTFYLRQGSDSLILKLGRVGLPPPAYQQAYKCGYSLPLEAENARWLSQAMAASGNTHVFLRSQIQPPRSGRT